MTDAAALRGEAMRWLVVAREDLRIADACVSMLDPSRGGAAYHLQQAAEKAIKGLLVQSATPFRRVHDLEELGALASQLFPLAAPLFDRVAFMTVWNTAYRYPSVDEAGDSPPSLSVIAGARQDVVELLTLLDSRIAGTWQM